MTDYYKRIKYLIRVTLLGSFNYCLDFISIIVQNRKIKHSLASFEQQKTICLISNTYQPRIEKIIYGLTCQGYNVVIFCKNPKFFDYTLPLFTFRSSLKVLWLAKQCKPLVYHVFANWIFDTAYVIIKNKKFFPIVVFDDYDVLAGMVSEKYIKSKYPDQLWKEKYCLENADGLCCRSIETQYAKHKLGYKYKGKRIFFPEYPWEIKVDKNTHLKKERTIIYAGTFNDAICRTSDTFKKANWSVDIYPSLFMNTNKFVSPDNFNIYKSLSHKELIEILKQYEIAIQFPGKIICGDIERYTPQKFYYSTAGKIFDYIEAGNKVLISDSIHQKWILKRYGAAIEIDEKNPMEDIIVKLIDYNANKSYGFTPLSTENLTILKQTERLTKFYKSLSR